MINPHSLELEISKAKTQTEATKTVLCVLKTNTVVTKTASPWSPYNSQAYTLVQCEVLKTAALLQFTMETQICMINNVNIKI